MRKLNKKTETKINDNLDILKKLAYDFGGYEEELKEELMNVIESFKDSNGLSYADYESSAKKAKQEILDEVESIRVRIEEFADNKSDKWLDGESGGKYYTWDQDWMDFGNEIDNCHIADIDEIEFEVRGLHGMLDIAEDLEMPFNNIYEVESTYDVWSGGISSN